ncbi:MAG: hypothetical protein V1743_05395 [Nanoarchaeota archaeon]
MNKILISCPVAERYAYCLAPYFNALDSQTLQDFSVMLVDNSKAGNFCRQLREQVGQNAFGLKNTFPIHVIRGAYQENVKARVINSRNLIREYALKQGFTHLFSLEIDVIPPVYALHTLLSRQKDIISGVYCKEFILNIEKNGKVIKTEKLDIPLLYTFTNIPGKMKRLLKRDVQEPRVMEIRSCGLGCVLIKKDVLEKVQFRHAKGNEGWDDVWFCNDAIDQGFRIFADTSITCQHLEKQKGEIWKEYDKFGAQRKS